MIKQQEAQPFFVGKLQACQLVNQPCDHLVFESPLSRRPPPLSRTPCPAGGVPPIVSTYIHGGARVSRPPWLISSLISPALGGDRGGPTARPSSVHSFSLCGRIKAHDVLWPLSLSPSYDVKPNEIWDVSRGKWSFVGTVAAANLKMLRV
jgi:hypothetical protein